LHAGENLEDGGGADHGGQIMHINAAVNNDMAMYLVL
jgi:hypothetical protein